MTMNLEKVDTTKHIVFLKELQEKKDLGFYILAGFIPIPIEDVLKLGLMNIYTMVDSEGKEEPGFYLLFDSLNYNFKAHFMFKSEILSELTDYSIRTAVINRPYSENGIVGFRTLTLMHMNVDERMKDAINLVINGDYASLHHLFKMSIHNCLSKVDFLLKEDEVTRSIYPGPELISYYFSYPENNELREKFASNLLTEVQYLPKELIKPVGERVLRLC